MAALSGRIFWDRFARFIAFWLIVALVAGGLYAAWSPLPARTLADIVAEGLRGDLARVSTEAFAFAAAKELASLAAGLAAAFGLLHALALSVSVGRARRFLRRFPSKDAFAENFEAVRARMQAHPLLGQAWMKFQAGILRGDDTIRSAQRPHSFFTYATIRERCIGLKIMQGVPNYFVGAGLLLTFVGLVIALYKAAEGTEAAQMAEAGAGAAAMQSALRDLLHAATFKFSTSIAGLSASIALAFVFRLYAIRIEASLGDFCEALEEKLTYVSPQSVAVEMRDALAAQTAQLKQIDSGEVLASFGQQAAHSIDAALTDALTPLTRQIRVAVDKLDRNNHAGMQDLVKEFSTALQGGASAELQGLSGSLQAVLGAMETVRSDMTRSGEAFSAKLGEAAENLNRLVSEAGNNLSRQSQTNSRALDQMLSALQAVSERASANAGANVSAAAEGAASKLAEAMDRVLAKFDTQFAGFKDTAEGHLAEIGQQMSEAQKRSAIAVADASARAAMILEEGLAGPIKSIRHEVEELAAALRASSSALGGQAEAIDRAVLRTRMTANAFEKCAETIGVALDPVTRSNEKMAEIASTMAEAVQQASASLDESQQATRTLSQALAAQVGRLTKLWENYESRFAKIDEDLQRAFEKLARETTKQSQLLAEQTIRVDKGLAGAVDKLAGPVQGIGDGAQEFSDAVGELWKLFDKMKAAA